MTIDEVLSEMQAHLNTRKPNEPPLRFDNWAALADLSYRALYARLRRKEHAPLLNAYMQAITDYHAAVAEALRAAGANHIGLLIAISKRFDISIKTLRNKANRMGLRSTARQRISVERCVAHAEVGMTLLQLAEVTGYKDYSLANLIPRGAFNGLLEFTVRPVLEANGRKRRRVVITQVNKRKART